MLSDLPPIPPEVFELTLEERMMELSIDKCRDVETLQNLLRSTYRQGLTQAKINKQLVQHIVKGNQHV